MYVWGYLQGSENGRVVTIACLTPCKYPFPLKSSFLNLKIFYIGGHFENFKNKEHNFEWWSIFVSSFKRIHLFGVNLTFFAPWLPWQWPPFWICSTPQKLPHYKVSWSLMKGIQIFFKFPLFYFHGNCGKVCPTDSDFFGLSRSTRCGCCSYQVSSISVWWVTCNDHFCVLHFFSILAISMAMAAILKKSTSHGIWYSYKLRIKFDQGISEKCVGQTFGGRKKERKKKNNNNNKKQSKHNMSPKLCLGDIIKTKISNWVLC